MMEGIKNIIFDFGGVIVDISRDNAVERFKNIGIKNADELLGAYKQEGIFLELEDGKISREGFYEALKKMVGMDLTNEQIDYAWLGFLLPLEEGRLEYILELRKKYKVYLLSNTNSIIMGWAHSKEFSKTGNTLDHYFDKLYMSYKMGIVKPHKEIFEMLIEDSGVKPEESLFVDDGAANIETAKLLGFKTYMPADKEDFRYYFGYKD